MEQEEFKNFQEKLLNFIQRDIGCKKFTEAIYRTIDLVGDIYGVGVFDDFGKKSKSYIINRSQSINLKSALDIQDILDYINSKISSAEQAVNRKVVINKVPLGIFDFENLLNKWIPQEEALQKASIDLHKMVKSYKWQDREYIFNHYQFCLNYVARRVPPEYLASIKLILEFWKEKITPTATYETPVGAQKLEVGAISVTHKNEVVHAFTRGAASDLKAEEVDVAGDQDSPEYLEF
jgi:hypothetical protein